MELLIHVPTFLNPFLEWILYVWNDYILVNYATCSSILGTSLETLSQYLFNLNTLVPILALVFFFWSIVLSLATMMAGAGAFLFWIVTSISFGMVQLVYVSYQFIMIACDVFVLSVLKTYSLVRTQILTIIDKEGSLLSRRRRWRQMMDQASNYEDFLKLKIEPNEVNLKRESSASNVSSDGTERDHAMKPLIRRRYSFSGNEDKSQIDYSSSIPRNRSFSREGGQSPAYSGLVDPVVEHELGKMAELLVTTTQRLLEARQAAQKGGHGAAGDLKYLLSGVVKRNHLQLESFVIQNAQRIAEKGQCGLTKKTRQLIRKYYLQVEKGLQWLASAPSDIESGDRNEIILEKPPEIVERMNLVRKMKQNMGRTALMLSGGGAIAMYHLGVVRALIESKLYEDIKVISGTSGGSIAAAMCAIKTPEELYNDVCVPNVSTDYMRNGKMKEQNIRWFPPLMDMASYWMRKKLLVDSNEFRRTCEFYYSDITFEEAFERTGKHVCITVSASRASGDTAQRLLLNHISTPHVTISSAVAASCALPGVMAPAKLVSKNSNGKLEPFEVDGVEWIDGSVQADLPFQRISTLFAVTSFIVSQTNFHVVPFLRKAHHPDSASFYWRLFQTMEWDIRNRALKLSRLGLFPKVFGQDVSRVFKQKYHGNLTIVPRFTTMQTLGLKALSNPTVEDMEGYLKYGQQATWPFLNAIRDTMRLEKELDDCLSQLERRVREINPEADILSFDDVESMTSASFLGSSTSRVRIIGKPKEFDPVEDSMRQRMTMLEDENKALRDKLERYERLLKAIVPCSTGDMPPDSNRSKELRLSDGAEGKIWNAVKNSANG